MLRRKTSIAVATILILCLLVATRANFGKDVEEMTVPELIEALKDADFNVILLYKVRKAFHKFGIDPAPGFIQTAHIEYHIRVLRALSNVGPDAVPDLIEALEDENKWIRNLATITLGHIGPKPKFQRSK